MTDVYALDLYHFTVVDRLFILIIIISVRVEIYKLLSILYHIGYINNKMYIHYTRYVIT